MRGGGQRPFGTFPKIHPFWDGHASLRRQACLSPPACFFWHFIQNKIAERRALNFEAFERIRTRTKKPPLKLIVYFRACQTRESEPAVHETDPEALPDYPHHSGFPSQPILPYNLDQTTPPDYPAQTILPDHLDQTILPDYTDNLSPSAPPAEFVTTSAEAGDAREAAAFSEGTGSGENEYEAPPSYDAAMRGDF